MKTGPFRGAVLLALLLAGCSVLAQGTAQDSSVPRASAQVNWKEFDRLVKGRFGAQQIDVACESPFDSASPIGMAAEIVLRRTTRDAADQIAMRLGGKPLTPAAKRKEEDEWMRQTARHKVWLPVSAEELLGAQLHDAVVKGRQLVAEEDLSPREADRLAQIRTLLSRMVESLPRDQPFKFKVFVSTQRESTLAAHMGGYLYVSEGLLRDRSLEEADLALRIAHEVAHVTKRHVIRDFQTKLVDSLEVGKQTESELRLLADPLAAFGLVMRRLQLAQALARTFDHHNELEADSCAVWLMSRVSTPEAMRSAIDRFASQDPGQGADARSADGSIHPRNDLRAQVMRMQFQRALALHGRGSPSSSIGSAPSPPAREAGLAAPTSTTGTPQAQPPAAAAPTSETPHSNASAVNPGTASPQEACGKRVLLALARCMERQCAEPRFADHPQCAEIREVKNRGSTPSAPRE